MRILEIDQEIKRLTQLLNDLSVRRGFDISKRIALLIKERERLKATLPSEL